MNRLVLALLVLLAAAPLCAQQAVVTKAIDPSTGATTDIGNATDHAIRVTQASGGTVWTFNWTQLLGAAPSATNPMPSRLSDGTTYIDPRSIRALTSSDVVTVVQGTGSNLHVVVDTAPTTAVTGTFWQVTQPVSGTVTTSPPANASTDITKIGGATLTIGQQLAAASIPVILPAATVTTLTPPAAITGFALEAGHLATIDTSTARIPAQGQAVAGASMPVVLPAAQITTLTPPTTVAVTSAGLTNLDVALSTRTKPADQQHAILDSGTTVVTQGTGSNLHIVCDSGCSSSAGFADNAAFTFGTTSVNPIAGVLDDVATNTATENSASVARITPQKGLHINLRNQAGTEIGTSTTPVQVSLANTGANTNKLLVTPDSVALPANQSVNVNQFGGASVTIGQQLAAASLPVILPAATITTLTPPAAITGYALDATLTGGTAQTKITDGTNVATVKAASTLPAATDKAVVVTLRESLSTAVTGPLTDTQLRASAVPVSLASAPTTAVTNAGLTNLDVALSTRTKPADQQHTIIDSGTTVVTQATGTNLHVVNDAGTAIIGALVANQSTNTAQIAGVTVSTGNGVPDTGTQRVFSAQRRTYSASTTAKTATAAGTAPFFALCGSASQTVRVQKVILSGTVATAAIYGDVVLKKTSTATSGGTATALTRAPHDSNSAAATATINYYTVLATAGTSVGVVQTQSAVFPLTGTVAASMAQLSFLDMNRDPVEAIVLRGVAQCVEMSFGTTPTNAPTLAISATWTEE